MSWDARHRRPPKCPNCDNELTYDEVDVGVGFISSPAWCDNPDCGYDEDAGGLVEPDGRVPSNEVPSDSDVHAYWDSIPLVSHA
jgi:hypothetical protein